MKNFALSNILSAAAFSLVAGFSINASSAENIEETQVLGQHVVVRSVRLQYSASQLATEEGRMQLQHRIRRAARKVCGRVERGNLHEAPRISQCYKEAQQVAMSQIGLDQVAVIGD
jgi:UrcA family protein